MGATLLLLGLAVVGDMAGALLLLLSLACYCCWVGIGDAGHIDYVAEVPHCCCCCHHCSGHLLFPIIVPLGQHPHCPPEQWLTGWVVVFCQGGHHH
jgi:hypothetical protein